MENPSLRVNEQGGRSARAGRTPSWKILLKTKYGQWAIDELTGEQGYIDDERSCFLDVGRQRVYLAVQTVLRSPSEEKKRQRKRKRQRWMQRNRKSISW